MNKRIIVFSILLALSCFLPLTTQAQTTTFTYQGRLSDSSAQANGTYDLSFALFDAPTGGAQIGAPQTRTVTISNGTFTVQLDFNAAAFPGADRYLEISVKRSPDTGFTTLQPRQQITSTPYAVRALAATTADNATSLNGQPSSNYVTTNDARLSDSRQPTAGSNFYIQNQTAAQQSANFNISGNGTLGGTLSANAINSATQYNIGGSRVLSVAGTNNTFVGLRTGTANTGAANIFVGEAAGLSNTTGSRNAFAGVEAGRFYETGSDNSFFGNSAGRTTASVLSSGSFNSFFGGGTGNSNVTCSNNTVIGYSATSSKTI